MSGPDPNDERKHLALRIRELFDLEVAAGLAPNSAAVKAAKRANREVLLQARCTHFFPHVDGDVAAALVCSAPDAVLTHDLATQLEDLNGHCAPPHSLLPCLLALDPSAPWLHTQPCSDTPPPVWQTDCAVQAPVLSLRLTIVVSTSDEWQVEQVEPCQEAAATRVEIIDVIAFRAMQVGNLRLRVTFRRMGTAGEEEADVLIRVVGIRVESVVFQFVAAIDRCYDSFFNAPLLPSALQDTGDDGHGQGKDLQEALLMLCLSANDDLATFGPSAGAFGGGGVAENGGSGIMGMARAIGAGDMLDGLSDQITTLQEDLGKAMDTDPPDPQVLPFHFYPHTICHMLSPNVPH